MTEPEFNACFQDWLRYKTARAKEWSGNLSGVYFKALGQYRPAELQRALDYLIEQQAEFPSISKIRDTIQNANEQRNMEDDSTNIEAERLVLIAGQLIDAEMGLPFKKPEDYVSWLDEVVEKALESARKEVDRLVRDGYIPADQRNAQINRYATGAANRLVKGRL